jgi:4-carboxymuconolactone decarboxylase
MDSPRIPPLPPEDRSEEAQELLAGLGEGNGAPLNIFATFARHPKLAKRWMAFGGTLLFQGALPERDRELLILRTARRCDAEYEWGQHTSIARAAGVTDEEIVRVAAGPDADGWEPFDATLLRAADELHDDAIISDATWADLATRYDERQLIELPMLVGQYHLVAFALNSLAVQREPGVPGFPG